MTIQFNIRFSTKLGQRLFISGNIEQLGNDDLSLAIPMDYLDSEFWHGTIDIDDSVIADEFNYRYILREDDLEIIDGEEERNICIPRGRVKNLFMLDTWNHAGNIENSFFTKPFRTVLLPGINKSPKPKQPAKISHEFRVKVPLLNPGEIICLLGSAYKLNGWDTTNPVLMTRKGSWFSISLNLSGEHTPMFYKYGVYNITEKLFIAFESGNNRMMRLDRNKKKLTIIHDGFVQLPTPTWRGAGIAIPVFSLRSNKGFGVGEFTDIMLLVDWAKQTGLKMIQILPINDTTSTHSWQDSYPYSAISAFALHPLYINLETVAGAGNKSIIRSLRKKQKALNGLDGFDYEQVMNFKLSTLKEIFRSQRDTFLNDPAYFEFFELNRDWLVPYAAFCFLRDKYKTADFSKWKANTFHNEDSIQKLVAPSKKHYNRILFHYFTQYHLHLQLEHASKYAHKNGIILKGDIPIGISRNSVDAWIDPAFYNMDQQAGAPPDDFAVKGQNWGFPTYNWKKMQEDGYSWWRHRFEQMSNYFDAFRIDHILGFFRIWSIPSNAVEGIMGKFVPALTIHISEFHNNAIWFDYERYCKPYITDTILESFFGDQLDFIKENFLDEFRDDRYKFKDEFDTQRKIEKHLDEIADDGSYLKQGLFDLFSNLILIEENGSRAQHFHFRIAMQKTTSFHHLDKHTQSQLQELYINYFFKRQDEFWKKEGMKKLPCLKRSTNMLICGEDLGMVPECVPDVMKQLAILSLEIQRMPKDSSIDFFHPKNAPYLSVVTPSTHDMSTIRSWWEEDRSKTQKFYNYLMGHYGEAPYYCEPWINKEVIVQHLYSPAMWSIFQIQDLLGMSETLRRENPHEERINEPSDPKHYWRYRMHLPLETLIKEKIFNAEIKTLVEQSGRI